MYSELVVRGMREDEERERRRRGREIKEIIMQLDSLFDYSSSNQPWNHRRRRFR
jgi:hypothetical protein